MDFHCEAVDVVEMQPTFGVALTISNANIERNTIRKDGKNDNGMTEVIIYLNYVNLYVEMTK